MKAPCLVFPEWLADSSADWGISSPYSPHCFYNPGKGPCESYSCFSHTKYIAWCNGTAAEAAALKLVGFAKFSWKWKALHLNIWWNIPGKPSQPKLYFVRSLWLFLGLLLLILKSQYLLLKKNWLSCIIVLIFSQVFILFISVFSMCACKHSTCLQSPHRPEEGIESPGLEL